MTTNIQPIHANDSWIVDSDNKVVGVQTKNTAATFGNVTATTDPVTGRIRYQDARFGVPQSWGGVGAYEPSLLNHATSVYVMYGYDDVDDLVFIRDDTNSVLRIATTTDGWKTLAFSGNKGAPADVTTITSGGISKVLRFKNKIYMLAKATVSGIVGIYRADPALGNTAYSWSGQLLSLQSGGAGVYTAFTASNNYIYCGEGGDPANGPNVYRSSDGISWDLIWTETDKAPKQRHVHGIYEDPYNPSDLWLLMGDANAQREIMRSRDGGVTWEVVFGGYEFQGVQCSFTSDYVWVAGDSARGVMFTINKSSNEIRWASHGTPKNIAVPAAAALGDQFYSSASLGILDPTTMCFYSYAADASSGGNTAGIFITPYPGGPLVLLEKLANNGGYIDIFGGYLWFGRYRRKLHG